MTPPPPAGATGRRVLINTTSLGAATFWRMGVAFVLQILVARRLGAAALGDYAVTLALLNVGQILVEAGLPTLLLRTLPGAPQLHMSMWLHVGALQTIFAVIVGASLTALAWLFPSLFPPATLIGGAAVSLLAYAGFSAGQSLLEASERHHLVMLLDTITNGLLLVTTILLLNRGYGLPGAFIALAVTQAASVILSLFVIRSSGVLAGSDASLSLRTSETLRRAAPYFGLALTDVLQQRADLLLLGALAGPTLTGLYAAAVAVMRILIKLAQSWWRALLPTLARLRDSAPERFLELAAMALRFALILMLPAAALGRAVSGDVVALLYGSDYAQAATLLALLLWSAPLYTWETGTITLLLAEKRPGRSLTVALLHLAALALLLPLLVLRFGILGAAVANLLAAGLAAVAGTALARASLVRTESGRLLAAGIAATGAGVLAWLLPLPWWAGVLVGLLLYAILTLLLRALSAQDVRLLRRSLGPAA